MSAAQARASSHGSRTSRSGARRTARSRSGTRSAGPATPASTSTCSGTQRATYTAAALPTDAMTVAYPKRPTRAQAAKSLKPNELGVVPVLMHHQIRPDGSAYDLTAGQFRAELARLWTDGFYPVRASDLVSGRLDVPKGRSPVVLTFDDATNNQVAFAADGRLDPDSAVGILEAFSARHPDFPATGTFYVPRNAFDGNGSTAEADVPLAARARLRARQPHEGPPPPEHARRGRGATPARPRRPPVLRSVARLPAADDGPPVRRAAAPAVARGRRPLGRRVVPLRRRLPLRRGARPVAVLDEMEPPGDPADRHESRTGRAPATSRGACGSTPSSAIRACATSPTATRARSASRATREAELAAQ